MIAKKRGAGDVLNRSARADKAEMRGRRFLDPPIRAANDQYWFGDSEALLKEKRRKIRRVYLLTGQNDEVAENTKRVGEQLKAAKVRVRVQIAEGLGHEIAGAKMKTYRRPLRWLTAG